MKRGSLKRWAALLKGELLTVFYAARDPEAPWLARLVAIAVAAYALSPIDLIPDFIPVLGYVDDLILLPAAIYLALKLIPREVLEDGRARAVEWIDARPPATLARYIAAGIIVLIWLTLAGLLWIDVVDRLEGS